ncbi:MAG: TlpA family protein disulfide reductase [Planctomycetota bacterium]|nr:MAG: TlpA family protein disulfide reductase [Planctomycetota bacterium]
MLSALALAGCGEHSAAPAVQDVRVADLQGLEQALAAKRGQALLVNFWATWCPPCVAELPDLVDTAREYEPRGLHVLGVSFDLMVPKITADAGRELVSKHLERRKLAFPSLVYDGPDYDAINARFELPGFIPVTLAIDRSGNIVDREEGPCTRERFAELARKALGI